MTPILILDECRRRGVTVRYEGGKLWFRGQSGKMANGLIECARRYKNELIALLATEEPDPDLVHPDSNLVHPTPDLVHQPPRFSPLSDQGGLGAWIDGKPSLAGGSDGEEEENSKSSPLSPPYCRDIHTRSRKIPPAQMGALTPSQVCARGIMYYTPPYLRTECGLSGPSGLTEDLSAPDSVPRWGPSLDHSEPSIDIPAADWRWRVANLPHAEWVRWRARSAEILATLVGDRPHAEQIVEADRLAAAEMGVAGANRTPTQSLREVS